VKNNFIKLRYKKKIITVQEMFLIRNKGIKGSHEEVPTWKIIEVPTDTSNQDFDIELEEEKST
jgi:hypothetical protein